MFPAGIACVVKFIDGAVAVVVVYAIAGILAKNNGSEPRVRVDCSRIRADDPVSFFLRLKPAGVVVADEEAVSNRVLFSDIPDRGPGILVSKRRLEVKNENLLGLLLVVPSYPCHRGADLGFVLE